MRLAAGAGVLALGAAAPACIVVHVHCPSAGRGETAGPPASSPAIVHEQGTGGAVLIDPSTRSVTTPRFFAQWSASNPADPEALDVLQWRGQASVTRTLGSSACNSGDVEYFGNGWAGAQPQSGDRVFVGAGSTGSWKPLDVASVTIESASKGCPPSANVPVSTTYEFAARGPAQDVIRVRRVVDFGLAGLRGVVRPYIPRFSVGDFSRVVYPDAAGAALVTEDVMPCGWGCQRNDWNGTWFAVVVSSGPLFGQGVIVVRRRSDLTAALWLDWDSGSGTNATSVVWLQPNDGFKGRLEEDEALCFFDASSWPAARRSALVLPDGCEALTPPVIE